MKNNVATLFGVVGLTTAATLFGATEAQAVILLDNFTEGAITVGIPENSPVGSTATGTSSGGSILGGSRKIDLEVVGTTDGNPTGNDSNANVNITNGHFNINEGAGVDLNTLLTYDNNGNGLGGVDFSGESGIQFTNFASPTDLTATLMLTDTLGESASTNSSISIAGSTGVLDFGSLSNGGFDLSTVDKVEIGLFTENSFGSSSTIARIDTPEAVPFETETSVAFLLLGSWGAWKYWKRNKQKVQINTTDEV